MGHARQGTAGVWGLAAALVGVLAGQITSIFTGPSSSPMDAVGSFVIDLTPAPVKEWAVATFGTGDKAFLLVVIAIAVAALGWVAGVLQRRTGWVGAVLLGALGLGSGLIATTRAASSPTSILAGMLAALVAVWVLRWGIGRLRALEEATNADTTEPNRRLFMIGGAGVALGGLGLAAVEGMVRPAAVGVPPIALPTPTTTSTLAPGLETTISGLSPLRTPIEDFYRIDIALSVPRREAADWELVIDGMVRNPFTITFDELLAMPMVERDVTLTCVSNPIGGPYVGSTRWQGVLVADIIRRADPEARAEQILSSGADGFSASTPLGVMLDGRDAMIAVAMDGQPLTRVHGFPARLLTPGLYGYVGATKWLEKLTLTTFDEAQSYWTKRGWGEQGPVKTATRIDVPGNDLSAGDATIAGVAWATHRGISKVEVRVDDGPWQEATLGEDVDADYWRQWHLPWKAESGTHQLTARATDGKGEVQTDVVQDVLPDGPTGYHVRTVQVK
ncbi:molybdopterin-dependent oxidoreductase [Tessaracoccus antarcticus]|uniref:Oxidoreductase n=1 Tax=Tessaracoccus antarcticus TaxID=2479848 RepID=A0A3M0G9F1_9ACTN|nr:molybdopterin-dependent oxidoreductase [Tessaracoccus antarcticus]RMB61565.1 oxidoreductase [Tessaracoccus antarcticus]